MLGTLRLGVVTAALSEPLFSSLAAFRTSRSRVDLRVVEVDTPAGQLVVMRHDIDIAVVRLSAPTRTLAVRPWRRDHFGIVLREDHPAASSDARPVDLARFADDPWVPAPRRVNRLPMTSSLATCRRAGFTPDVRHGRRWWRASCPSSARLGL